MARLVKIVPGTVAAVALVTVAAVAVGRSVFKRRVSQEVAELFARSKDVGPIVLSEADLAGLPEPVQRWLRTARVVGKERPITVRLKQAGLMRQKAGQAWMPLEAEEYYTTDPPGFVWVATARAAPGLVISGRDRYEDGKGHMTFRLLSLIPVADAQGPELDQGALLRYLNETMWFPAAALSPYIAWEGIDANAARATMSYQGVSASATFYFNGQGDLTNMVAERYRTVDGQFTLDTWSTPISEYGECNDVRIPVEGEAVWKLSSGAFSYIKLRVTELEYNHAAMYSG